MVMALKIMIGLQWHIVMVQLKVNASTKGQKMVTTWLSYGAETCTK